MKAVPPAVLGAPVSNGWTAMEVLGLVTTGLLVISLWLVFRKLKFPE
ncbi:MAG: hypothetical protein FJ086_02390 [Deltaproteobacteria bacterium]|nr:hypothetical protein [Deltaproteobacteria bacterium]